MHTARISASITGVVLLLALLFGFTAHAESYELPKREFRGAWLHIIGQNQWMGKSKEQTQKYITQQLDKLAEVGCNAVIFQVRPTADAFYISELEPWTYWYTGKRGKAPSELWDPMAFTIEEAHKRGMEFHAWLNPYRVTSSPKEVLPPDHLANREPQRFVKFDGKIFFDPAYQENRDFICEVVADIVDRYDVDAIHIDDYFYPYPAGGKKFDADDASYAKFGTGMPRADWRRHNVDLLIEQLHKTIRHHKPWVRFGVSPFGIWRNKSSDPRGSNSSGLQNYDDLYADVLLWDQKGWIDYVVPQLYWTLDMKAAPSRHLAHWWNDNIHNAQLYIGWDVQRTMGNADPGTGNPTELDTKVALSRSLPNVDGNVWWHGYWVTGNLKGVADSLAFTHQKHLALPPVYGDEHKHPEPVSNLRLEKREGKTILAWDAPYASGKEHETDVNRFVVYEFFPDEKVDIDNSAAIIAVTPLHAVEVAEDTDPESVKGLTFVVTSLDRMNRESSAKTLDMRY